MKKVRKETESAEGQGICDFHKAGVSFPTLIITRL